MNHGNAITNANSCWIVTIGKDCLIVSKLKPEHEVVAGPFKMQPNVNGKMVPSGEVVLAKKKFMKDNGISKANRGTYGKKMTWDSNKRQVTVRRVKAVFA